MIFCDPGGAARGAAQASSVASWSCSWSVDMAAVQSHY